MSDMQQIEINRYRKELEDDVRALVEKYRRAMDWDIPGNDDRKSDRLILAAIRQALEGVEKSLS
ncbi:MAG TPA: hypothetical protein ENK50_03735 [Sedimenticola sp.]|nr:hypothetical protein [Sedimenticola sp.]